MRSAVLQLLSASLLFMGALGWAFGIMFLRSAFQSPAQPAGHLNEGPTLFGFVGAALLIVGLVLILLGRACWKSSERPTKDQNS